MVFLPDGQYIKATLRLAASYLHIVFSNVVTNVVYIRQKRVAGRIRMLGLRERVITTSNEYFSRRRVAGIVLTRNTEVDDVVLCWVRSSASGHLDTALVV